VFSLFVLSSYAQPIDKVGLLPGEARKLALAELTLHKRIGQLSRLLSPLTPEDALRRHGIADAKAAPALDRRDLPDVAAIQSRFEHVVPAPPGSAASTRDPEAYALALLYPDLQVGAAALHRDQGHAAGRLLARDARGCRGRGGGAPGRSAARRPALARGHALPEAGLSRGPRGAGRGTGGGQIDFDVKPAYIDLHVNPRMRSGEVDMAHTDYEPHGAVAAEADDGAINGFGEPAQSLSGGAVDPEKQARIAEAALLSELEGVLSERDIGRAEAGAAKETARLMGMQIVRNIQKHSGMTLDELSRRSGVAVGTISRLATGARGTGPALWTLIALSQAGGVPLSLPEG
jgi:hypothetical protein